MIEVVTYVRGTRQSVLLFIQIVQVQRRGFTLGLISYLHHSITM